MAGGFPFSPVGVFVSSPATLFQATLVLPSFRGVPFFVEEFGGGVGRRGDLHEYPLRDIPDAEDLGRRARRWRFRAYVLGDDALAQWQGLCFALEQPGPGMLVLSDGSPVLAQVDPKQEQRYTLTLDKLRKVSFELSFVEAGQTLYPGSTPDTQANSQAAAANLISAANSDGQANVAAVGGPTMAQAQQNFQNASDQLDAIGFPFGAPPGDAMTESIVIDGGSPLVLDGRPAGNIT